MRKHLFIFNLILLCFTASATSIIPFKNINHLSESSHCIYLAKAISTGEETNNGITQDYTVFEVQDVIKGKVIQQFKIKSENLRKGDETFFVAGNPDFDINESYLLFLKDSQEDFKSPICMSYYIFQEKIINGEKVLAPSQNEHFYIVGKQKQINAIYKQKEFLTGLKSLTKTRKLSQEQLETFVSTHKLKDTNNHKHKSAPSHCNHLPREEDSPNDRRRSRIENAEAQAYPVYYSSTGSGCSNISGQVAGGIAHLNSNYTGINFDFKGSFTGFPQNPICAGGSISQDNRDFIDQNFPEYNGRAALIHFDDPCNQLTGDNAGVIAVGGSWLSGSHNFKGENFRTAKYGRVIVNVGIAELCNRNSVSSQFTDYELMIAHELTHVAGLDHIESEDGKANMNPSLRSSITHLDVQCMNDLYPFVAPQPDLRVDINSSSISFTGLTMNINDVVIINEGNRTAGSSKLAYYLSTDANITNSDILISQQDVPPIASGQTANKSLTVDLTNFAIPGGKYRLGAIIDSNFDVSESDENNNTWVLARELTLPTITPRTDFIVECGTVTMNDLTVQVENAIVKNIGQTANQTNVKVGFYLSTNSTITTIDRFIGFSDIGILQANDQSTISFSKDLRDQNIPLGRYFLGIIVDYDRRIDELRENNNSCGTTSDVVNIVIIEESKPDLIVTCGNASINGTTVSISNARVTNNGNETSASGRIVYYLSEDKTITVEDSPIGFYNHVALAAGQSIVAPNESVNVNISSINVPNGEYYFGVIADFTSTNDESNENNNTCVQNESLTVGSAQSPDLVVQCGNATVNGTNIQIQNIVVKNVGSQASHSSKLGFYLTNNQNASDIKIGERSIGILNPNASNTKSLTVDVASLGLSNGTYSIKAVADFQRIVQESNENNNTCIIANTSVQINDTSVSGDFTVHCSLLNVSDDSKVIMGAQVRNQGTAMTAPTEIGYYLSTDNNITTDDFLIDTDQVQNQLNPGDIKNNQVTIIKANLNVPAGEYYVGAIVDYLSTYSELDENNNSCVSTTGRISIGTAGVTGADLIVSCGSYTASGNLIRTNGNIVTNQGTAKAGNVSRLGYYISSDKNITSSDHYLAEDYVYDLDPGDTSTENQTLYIDYSKLSAGTYYVGMIADHQNVTDEPSANKQNNSCIVEDLEIEVGNNLTSGSETRNLIIPASVEEQDNFDITIFPNPVKGDLEFFIDIETKQSQNIKIEIFNQIGEPVYKNTFAKISEIHNIKIKNPSLSKGTYYVRVNTEWNSLVKKLLVIE